MDRLSSNEYLRFWWAFFWRATSLGFVGGTIIGIVVGALMAMAGLMAFVQPVVTILGLGVNAIVTFLMLRVSLEKSYPGFSLRVDRGQVSAFD